MTRLRNATADALHLTAETLTWIAGVLEVRHEMTAAILAGAGDE